MEKRHCPFIFILIFFALLAAPNLSYALPQLESAAFTASSVTLGQTINFRIQIRWQKDEKVYAFKIPNPNLNRLSLIRQGESQETLIEGGEEWVRKTFEFEFKAEEPGQGILNAFEISFSDSPDHPEIMLPETLFIAQQKILIRGNPWYQNPGFRYSATAAAAILVFLGFGFVIIRSVKRKNQSQKNPPPTPEALSLGRVQNLLNQAHKPQKELLHELSLELRGFITDYYQLQNRSLTETELIETLTAKEALKEDVDQLKKLFEALNQAKYTGASVSADDLKFFQKKVVAYMESKKVIGQPQS